METSGPDDGQGSIRQAGWLRIHGNCLKIYDDLSRRCCGSRCWCPCERRLLTGPALCLSVRNRCGERFQKNRGQLELMVRRPRKASKLFSGRGAVDQRMACWTVWPAVLPNPPLPDSGMGEGAFRFLFQCTVEQTRKREDSSLPSPFKRVSQKSYPECQRPCTVSLPSMPWHTT